jgi:hypothetical protein
MIYPSITAGCLNCLACKPNDIRLRLHKVLLVSDKHTDQLAGEELNMDM